MADKARAIYFFLVIEAVAVPVEKVVLETLAALKDCCDGCVGLYY